MMRLFSIFFFALLLFTSPHVFAQDATTAANEAIQRRDYATAIQIVTPIAEKGDDQAAFYLSMIYGGAYGPEPTDTALALKWLTAAAERGMKEAQAELGDRYLDGLWVKQDFPTAAKWYRKSADQGYARAQSLLGQMTELGKGMAPDPAEALKLYLAAAAQGHAVAQVDVGRVYARGVGVPQDAVMAVKYFRMAADQSNVSAEIWMSSAYEMGAGVKKDFTIAYMWTLIAQKNADLKNPATPLPTGFAVILDNLGKQMSGAEIQLAHQMADGWKPHQ